MTETELAHRLERLERDNRRLKGFVVVALILAAGLAAAGIYLARQDALQAVSGVVKARKFEVLDEHGRVSAIISSLLPVAAGGEVGPQVPIPRHASLGPALPVNAWGLGFSDGSGNQRTMMVFPAGGSEEAYLWVGGLLTPVGETFGAVAMGVNSDGRPGIDLRDGQGFEMQLGGAETSTPSTGESQKTSAASIVMSNKKGNILWRAP